MPKETCRKKLLAYEKEVNEGLPRRNETNPRKALRPRVHNTIQRVPEWLELDAVNGRRSMKQAAPVLKKPTFFERIFNKAFGVLVRLGIGMRHNYLLEVAGRRTGRLYSTPIDLLEFNARTFLVRSARTHRMGSQR